nr:uncharacterized protein LOC111752776 [Loxodonta africana]
MKSGSGGSTPPLAAGDRASGERTSSPARRWAPRSSALCPSRVRCDRTPSLPGHSSRGLGLARVGGGRKVHGPVVCALILGGECRSPPLHNPATLRTPSAPGPQDCKALRGGRGDRTGPGMCGEVRSCLSIVCPGPGPVAAPARSLAFCWARVGDMGLENLTLRADSAHAFGASCTLGREFNGGLMEARGRRIGHWRAAKDPLGMAWRVFGVGRVAV